MDLELTPSNEMIIDLKNPVYKNSILYTHQGGIIRNRDIRIQAKSIQYFQDNDIHKIEAEGDLLIQYKGQIFVGSEFIYDFNTKSGVIYGGKTFSSIWYIGGEEIHLHPDGTYEVIHAFVTTCENEKSTWDFHADHLQVKWDHRIEAKNVRFRLFRIPTLWLPSFKVDLDKFKQQSLFKYTLTWDSGLGPRAGIRYQFYSCSDFAMYGRVEYRWATGWGGAFETEYFPSHTDIQFVTRSYLGTDRLVQAPDKMRRYRLQGSFKSNSQDRHTTTLLTWDKYSDVRMPSDFKSDDFEVDTAKKTILYVNHRNDYLTTTGKIRPKVNPFESIKQDLPTFQLTVQPLTLGKTNLVSSTYFKASYLDFSYSSQLSQNLNSFHSPRIEMREKLIYPFQIGLFSLCPNLGGTGIFYGNSPNSSAKWLGILSYGFEAQGKAIRSYSNYKHQIIPYFEYIGLSSPTVEPGEHYIFSIQDGYDQINQFKFGLRNLLFSHKRPYQEATWDIDLFANAFFAKTLIPQAIPWLYLNCTWRLPSLYFSWQNAWNFQHRLLQHTNARVLWTINENAALSIESRYRSKYDWRKADPDNFILDVSRSESELLQSPLSDQRLTILTNLFFRLTPLWECQIRSHHGFLRPDENPYNEIKVDLLTWLTSSIKWKISFSHTDQADKRNSVSTQIFFVKK